MKRCEKVERVSVSMFDIRLVVDNVLSVCFWKVMNGFNRIKYDSIQIEDNINCFER